VRNYKRALEDGVPGSRSWWARAAAKLGLAPLARFVLADQTWLAIVLADLEQFCSAGIEDTSHIKDDPSGRNSALQEGRRQVYLRISGCVALTPAEMLALERAIFSEEKDDLDD
jgi:hypothetical protein